MTNRRLVFVAKAREGYERQTEVPLDEVVDVSMKGKWFWKYVRIESGMGNIVLHMNDVNEQTFGEFKRSIESAAGKSLDRV